MNIQEYFYSLSDRLQTDLEEGETFTCWFSGEESDFVRFNHGLVRQAGQVKQGYLQASIITGQKQSQFSMVVSGDLERDGDLLEEQLKKQREKLELLPEDPYLLYSKTNNSSQSISDNQLESAEQVVEDVLSLARGQDLVGIYAGGALYRGFSNSFGQRNWFAKHSFNLDYSIYLQADKAVKAGYAGFTFDRDHLARELELIREKLTVLSKPAQTIKPGKYKAYFTPMALYDLVGMLGWGALSEKSLRTKQSALSHMRDDGVRLNPGFSLYEHSVEGTGPLFQSQGFMKPDCVTLIENGELVGSLISPRTAKEYDLDTNGASGSESPESYSIKPGDLDRIDILKRLDTGLFIGNLWYLNYSDRQSARITGMTRFACFWVENGKIVAPVNVMRFDDSLYSLFGDNLEALTKQRDFILDAHTYEERATSSAHLPGLMVKEFNLTL